MAQRPSGPVAAHSFDVEDDNKPPELSGCAGCCVMCCFGCLTCCGCRNIICRKLIFFPPEPPFYKVDVDDLKNTPVLLRIPLPLLPQAEFLSDEDLKLMTPAQLPHSLEIQMLRLKTSKKSHIMACFISHPKAKDTILYSHGNATDVGMQSYAVETLVIACRVNVLFYDYTGYGYSGKPGLPSPAHIESDIQAAFDYLVNDAGIPANRIILYGQSLGSVPSCILAKKHRVKGMVIHAGLASAIRVLKPSLNKSPWFDLFRNADYIKEAKCPVFVIHGTLDQAVPFSNGKLLYDNAPIKISPWWVEGANHNDIEMNYARQYYVRLSEAFREFTRMGTAEPGESKTPPNDNHSKEVKKIISTQPGAQAPETAPVYPKTSL